MIFSGMAARLPSRGHSPAVGGFAAYGWGVLLASKTAWKRFWTASSQSPLCSAAAGGSVTFALFAESGAAWVVRRPRRQPDDLIFPGVFRSAALSASGVPAKANLSFCGGRRSYP